MLKNLVAIFGKPSPAMLARRELEEAERCLLQAQSAAEYAKRMTEYHNDRIKRLTQFLSAAHSQQDQR